ncbi:MAG: hypothetical protein IPN06_19550 [Burkholderiales bacterium]|nr:hypothetical protein [Burkholderiales bacterium]
MLDGIARKGSPDRGLKDSPHLFVQIMTGLQRILLPFDLGFMLGHVFFAGVFMKRGYERTLESG